MQVVNLLFVLFFMALGLGALVLWIWTLIDCINNEPSEGNDKIVWILVIIFLGAIGALLYFVVRRPTRVAEFGR